MPGPTGLIIWFLGTAFELLFVVCSLARNSFLRYFFLNLYLLLSTTVSIGRFFILWNYGVRSDEYMYFYYYSDALLTLALFVALISLYSHVLGELRAGEYLKWGAVFLLLGTAGFSYAVVAQSADRLSTNFAYELSQNLYFVGLVLTYILWGAVLKLHETRTRVVQIILSLGLYFSAYAASYALMNFSEKYSLIRYLSPALGCFLPLSWSLTILRYSEESRLAPARLVAVPR
ncbi:MAG TPA: hypothetical protein VKA02_09355 [Candidatus Acidoferrum sp.]|nr:hypothetical protein [Candidatus Acidoferrum sp.]